MRYCAQPGCPTLVVKGRCATHARQADRFRGSQRERGYTRSWEKARKVFLAQWPLCRTCESQGITEPATVVDHVIPHRGDQALFWDEANWQSLCDHHHGQKTVNEDGGFGRG